MKVLDRVLFRDAWLLVIDKPAGLPVHPGPGGGDNLERYFDDLRFGLKKPPFLAHRLDRDTSGCLALGRHKQALRRLGELFSTGEIKKTYWAVVHGSPTKSQGTIDERLKKISRRMGGWRMIIAPDGQPSVTDYRLLGQSLDHKHSWLAMYPKTGRTHQLRVHLAHIGCPIVGDRQYGSKEDIQPLHLHARRLVVPLYPDKPAIETLAPLPATLAPLFETCGYSFKINDTE